MVHVLAALESSLADRYRIEREVGQGGMATVYLAYDLRHDRKVALKVLKPELAAVLGAERFVREIKTTASLSHPHILPLFDSGTADSFLFYVMPFIAGETLRDKLDRETQLGVEDAVRIAREVADALDYAHRHGVIHRDIKPSNILLAPSGQDGRMHALIADFGIALALPNAGDAASGHPATGSGHRLTQAGLTLGTPTYMSPEQAMGDTRVDRRSDVYSLACVVYEMLAGEPPFTGTTVEGLAARKISASIASIAVMRSSVPRSVDSTIARALAPVAADRWATAGEFVAALAGAFAAHGDSPLVDASQPSSSPTSVTRRRVLRPTTAVFGVSALALMAVVAWSYASSHSRLGRATNARTTRDSVAQTLYRQAHAEIDRRTEASIARSIDLLQRALARDSNYVDAWADLARALVFASNNRYDIPGIPPARIAEYTVRAGERALEADSTSAKAWIARALTLYLIDPTTREGEIRALHRAIALDPNSADAWHYLGTYYEDALDADSALIAFRRAIAIRPTHPQALAFLAFHYMWQRQPDVAMRWADSSARSNPTNILARQVRGLVLIQQGRVVEAEDEFAAVLGIGQGPERVWGWTGLAVVARRRHDRHAMDSLIVRAIADADTLRPSHHEAVYLAWMYAETGQRDRALAILERFAKPRHLHFQLHLLREFTLDSLRREPRFMALLSSDTTQRLR